MRYYDIEDIGVDHPALLTAHLEASAVACCRESGSSPWKLQNFCEGLSTVDTAQVDVEVAWRTATDARADLIVRTHQANRVTEDAAIGVCAAVLAALGEGQVTEVTQHGSRVDYWLDQRRAIVEISGLRRGNGPGLKRRQAEKQKQLQDSSLFKLGYPGYLFAVAFGIRQALIRYLELS